MHYIRRALDSLTVATGRLRAFRKGRSALPAECVQALKTYLAGARTETRKARATKPKTRSAIGGPPFPMGVMRGRSSPNFMFCKLGPRAGNVMGIVSLVSLAASISAMTIAGPRVYYAMARDGVFLPPAAEVHPRYRTPAKSIIAQSIWSGVLVLSGGADALIRYTGFAVVLFSGIAVLALFVLRLREPDMRRPFKALGYPVVPAIFTVASFLIGMF